MKEQNYIIRFPKGVREHLYTKSELSEKYNKHFRKESNIDIIIRNLIDFGFVVEEETNFEVGDSEIEHDRYRIRTMKHSARKGLVNGEIINDLFSLLDEILIDDDYHSCPYCGEVDRHIEGCLHIKYKNLIEKHYKYLKEE